MSSNGSGSNGQSGVAIVDASTSSAVLIHSGTALAYAAEAMARVEQEIDELWRDAITGRNSALSERLVEVSHALQRAVRVLEQGQALG